ncbi:MAG TPA: MJ0042-type zinc finger domain-containing protein, partial [Anaeromyxobacteraceae bacterium]
MKFACDSCGSQYMISDDKVGPNGVKVRCKKCSNVVSVKRAPAAAPVASPAAAAPAAPAPAS